VLKRDKKRGAASKINAKPKKLLNSKIAQGPRYDSQSVVIEPEDPPPDSFWYWIRRELLEELTSPEEENTSSLEYFLTDIVDTEEDSKIVLEEAEPISYADETNANSEYVCEAQVAEFDKRAVDKLTLLYEFAISYGAELTDTDLEEFRTKVLAEEPPYQFDLIVSLLPYSSITENN